MRELLERQERFSRPVKGAHEIGVNDAVDHAGWFEGLTSLGHTQETIDSARKTREESKTGTTKSQRREEELWREHEERLREQAAKKAQERAEKAAEFAEASREKITAHKDEKRDR